MSRPIELGNLEATVMRCMWALKRASVAEMVEVMPHARAYTTIMTTADRLFRKGLLRRQRMGRAFIYEPAVSESGLELLKSRRIFDLVFADGAPEPILSCLIDSVSEKDAAGLEKLEELVRQKLEQLRKA